MSEMPSKDKILRCTLVYDNAPRHGHAKVHFTDWSLRSFLSVSPPNIYLLHDSLGISMQ